MIAFITISSELYWALHNVDISKCRNILYWTRGFRFYQFFRNVKHCNIFVQFIKGLKTHDFIRPKVNFIGIVAIGKSTLWQQATIKFTRRDHSIIACSRQIYMVLFFAHIPFVVNRALSATPAEWLQHNFRIWKMHAYIIHKWRKQVIFSILRWSPWYMQFW